MSYTYFRINSEEVTKLEFEKHVAQYQNSLEIAHTLLEKGYCNAVLHPEIKDLEPNFLVALTKEEESLYKVIDTNSAMEYIPAMIDLTKAIFKAGYIKTTKLQYIHQCLSEVNKESQDLQTQVEYLSDSLFNILTKLDDIMED